MEKKMEINKHRNQNKNTERTSLPHSQNIYSFLVNCEHLFIYNLLKMLT